MLHKSRSVYYEPTSVALKIDLKRTVPKLVSCSRCESNGLLPLCFIYEVLCARLSPMIAFIVMGIVVSNGGVGDGQNRKGSLRGRHCYVCGR